MILRKIYEIIPDEAAATDDLLRIVDESGEDYLYHKSHFGIQLLTRYSNIRDSWQDFKGLGAFQ